MKQYIIILALFCFTALNAQTSKLSPYVRQAMMTEHSMHHKSKAPSSTGNIPTITAFIRTTDITSLRQQGCNIYAQWESTPNTTICIASIPLNRLSTLAAMPQTKRIEAGKSCFITNDTTATITRTRNVWQYPIPPSSTSCFEVSPRNNSTGTNVVVGIMDVGFDLTHPTFYTSDGQTYRISQFWDQLDQTQNGSPVIGTDTIYVGRQYIGQQALLNLQHSYDGLTQYHGTHTAGTAAGSGWQGSLSSQLSTLSSKLSTLNSKPSTLSSKLSTLSSKLSTLSSYPGMAPSADICLVCNATGDNAKLIPEQDQYKYTTATDMLGFKYIFDYADKVGKPCVINFSEGAHDDLYESGIYSEVLSKMLGPGHILCASAGNEGNGDGTYIHKATGETNKGSFLAKWKSNTAVYVMQSQKPVQMSLSFYKDNKKTLDKDYDLTSLADYPDSLMIDSVIIDTDTMLVALNTYPSCFDETLYATDFFLIDKNHDNCGYTIPTSITLLGEDNDIEAFCAGGYFVKNDLDKLLTNYDNTHNILFPGSAKNVICVGNTSYRTTFINTAGTSRSPYPTADKDGIISRYSSVGPAINGATKPDVVAPGMNIISSYNSFYRENNPDSGRADDVQDFTFSDRQYQWHACSGTSMSAPVVTGIIALWLQVCPTLSPDQIRDVIAHTSTHYDESLTYPNNHYGWGQIDAMAGIEYIQRVYTGIEEVKYPTPNTHHPSRIYSLDGRCLKNTNGLHGVFIVNGKKIVK